MKTTGNRARSHAHAHRRSRIILHLGIVGLLGGALTLTALRHSDDSAAWQLDSAPSVVYSGLSHAAAPVTAQRLSAGGSHDTRTSVTALTGGHNRASQDGGIGDIEVEHDPGRALVLSEPEIRSTDEIPPTIGLSTGVSAAALQSGETDSGLKPLADVLDPQSPYAIYIAQPNDSPAQIAEEYGISLTTLLQANAEMSDDSVLLVGQRVVVPYADGLLHTISHNETVGIIVNLYDGVTVEDVLAYRPNNVTDPDNVESGRDILLPGARLKPPPPPPPPPPTPEPTPPPPPPADPGSPDAPPADPAPDPEPAAPPPSSGGMFSLPLTSWAGISDTFGLYRGPGTYHTGLDLYGPAGTPIYAACNGTVTSVQYLTYSYGYHVIIDCGGGYTTLYGHMSRIDAVQGQVVTAGTLLGAMGTTGFSTGNHLHFEIRLNGAYLNPEDYLNFR